MAQLAVRAKLLARRMGLRPVRAAMAAFVVGTLALTGVGIGARMASQRGFEVIQQQEAADDNAVALSPDEASEGKSGDTVQEEPLAEVYVHVDGAVERPGVYVLHGTSPRVGEAVELAGGLTEDADTTTVNLAAPLADGQKVYVPHQGEDASAANEGAVATGEAATVVNINTATNEELQTLPGVGAATAEAIIEERESGGPFTSPEDIMRVTGIGEKKFERMRAYIGV